MPKESIAMSREEVLAFLAGERRAVLGTLDADAQVWPDAAACALAGETLYFRLPRLSRSCANLRRDPRVCCAMERFPSYYEIKGATVHGRAIEVTDPKVLPQARAALDAIPDPVGGLTIGQSAFYALGLDDVVSFDFAKIKKRV